MTETDLHLADLGGADLSQVRGLEQAQLAETCGDETTKLPAGIAPPASWPCTTAEEE
jgi:hypothetical protein